MAGVRGVVYREKLRLEECREWQVSRERQVYSEWPKYRDRHVYRVCQEYKEWQVYWEC